MLIRRSLASYFTKGNDKKGITVEKMTTYKDMKQYQRICCSNQRSPHDDIYVLVIYLWDRCVRIEFSKNSRKHDMGKNNIKEHYGILERMNINTPNTENESLVMILARILGVLLLPSKIG